MELDMKITHKEEQDCIEKEYTYLGWQVYSGNCEELKKCHDLGHRQDKDGKYNNGEVKQISHSQRGIDHTCWCEVCKIWWKIDSGD